MMVYLLGIVLALLFLCGFLSPFIGLLGLLAVNMMQPGELYPVFNALHVERALAILVLVSALIRRPKLSFPPLTKCVLLFWGAIIVSVPFAWWRAGALALSIEFTKIVIYHILIIALIVTERRLRTFLLTFVGLIGWVAASSAYDYAHGKFVFAQGIDRAVGLTSAGGDPNTLGLTLVSGLPFVMLFVFKGKKWTRWLSLLIALVAVYTVLVTGSRGSFFSLLFLGGCVIFVRKRNLFYLPIVMTFLIFIWCALPAEYQQRYLSVFSLKGDASYQNRVLAWQAGWQMFKDHPLTGVGGGQFPYASGGQYWPGPGPRVWLQPHSLYVQVMAELGIVGMIAFGLFLFKLLDTNRELSRNLRQLHSCPGWMKYFPSACLLSVLVLLFAGYAAHTLYRYTWYMLAALAGALSQLVEKNPARYSTAEQPGKLISEAEMFSSGYAIAGQTVFGQARHLENRGGGKDRELDFGQVPLRNP